MTPLEQAVIDVGGFGTTSFSKSGAVVGGAIGFNVQGPGSGIIIGVQADLLYADVDRTKKASFDLLDQAYQINARQHLDYLGMVRGRFGYAFDRVLVYGTGGFAFGDSNFKAQSEITNASYSGVIDGGKHDRLSTGLVYGGGVEFALPPSLPLNLFPLDKLTFKVEYLRYDLGSAPVTIAGKGPIFGPGGPLNLGHSATSVFETRGQIVNVGINYRF